MQNIINYTYNNVLFGKNALTHSYPVDKTQQLGIKNLKSDVFSRNIAFCGTNETAFFQEMSKSNPDLKKLVAFLWGMDFDIYAKDPKTNKTPLHCAVEKNWTTGADIIFKKHNSKNNNGNSKDEFVNSKDIDGKTPLHYAKKADIVIISMLLNNGADMQAVDKAGKIPAEYNADIVTAYNNLFKSRTIEDFVKKTKTPIPDNKPVHKEDATKVKPKDVNNQEEWDDCPGRKEDPKDKAKPKEVKPPTKKEVEPSDKKTNCEKGIVNTSDTTFSVLDLPSDNITSDASAATVTQAPGTPVTPPVDTTKYDTTFKREQLRSGSPKGLIDVAGMDYVKSELHRSLIIPLKPEIQKRYAENGLFMLNGVLLYGPPGNGKTYIAEATAAEAKLPWYKMDLTTIGSSAKNETSVNMSKLFNQLEQKFKETGERSIIFLDELDALAQKRSELGGNSTKKEEINTLLTLLNNASQRGIIVIAATNLKESIDEAVLRAGRFDKHIYVSPPDFEARKSILKKLLSEKPISKNIATDENINNIARMLSGFSASSIRYLMEETMRSAIHDEKEAISMEEMKIQISNYAKQQSIPEVNDYNTTSMYDTDLKRVEIRKDDPKSLDDIGGMFNVKRQLVESIIYPWTPSIRAELEKNKIAMPNGILLYGPPGCGKTYIMKAVAAQAVLPLYSLKLSQIGSPYINQTSNNMQAVFDQLKEKYLKTGEPSILFIDEMDSMATQRDSLSGNASHKRDEVNTLLQILDNASKNGIIVVGATNNIFAIDEAIKRTGRLDTHILVGLPDKEARRDVLYKLLKKKPVAEELIKSEKNINKLADLMEGLSNSDIASVVEASARQLLFEKTQELMQKAVKKNEIVTQDTKAKETETQDTKAKETLTLDDIEKMETVQQPIEEKIAQLTYEDIEKNVNQFLAERNKKKNTELTDIESVLSQPEPTEFTAK